MNSTNKLRYLKILTWNPFNVIGKNHGHKSHNQAPIIIIKECVQQSSKQPYKLCSMTNQITNARILQIEDKKKDERTIKFVCYVSLISSITNNKLTIQLFNLKNKMSYFADKWPNLSINKVAMRFYNYYLMKL